MDVPPCGDHNTDVHPLDANGEIQKDADGNEIELDWQQ